MEEYRSRLDAERRQVAQDRFHTIQEAILGLYRDQIDQLSPEA